ncbi:TetR family transcriptional regulator [Pseudoclavibacter chungangensis]|uniref:TetR family transcriptional regulator n=1 Tax=Pseudoclavibacter chungangensis TaxID=587635 RepID=A0A7J5BQZ6_9MICO|nr:TetR/AcrR family transcriptional regulator C-terminal domain-containing protein [Pseudoclavibacter chungangensis]KAB1654297.1 TetR family transcriptional regulator [Pseudoclavibacter chungangensis]NYJ65296.1 AcrR family transcriptional regulator [Pseudoclavibacter chungangensis]
MAPRNGASALTRPRIVDAAVALADEEGLRAVSMRRLAAQLGVEAMSIYHHVPNKAAILDAMTDRVFEGFHLPSTDGDWRVELHARADSIRTTLLRHRWGLELVDSRRSPGRATLAHHDAVIGCLRNAGCSLALTAHAFALLDAHHFGFVAQELRLPFEDGEALDPLAADIDANVPLAEFPHFAEFVTGVALRPGYAFGDEYGWGVELLLDELERRRAAEAPSTVAERDGTAP